MSFLKTLQNLSNETHNDEHSSESLTNFQALFSHVQGAQNLTYRHREAMLPKQTTSFASVK